MNQQMFDLTAEEAELVKNFRESSTKGKEALAWVADLEARTARRMREDPEGFSARMKALDEEPFMSRKAE